MKTITLPVQVVKAMMAAIECAQALDMPTREGDLVLCHHGWEVEDRFDVPATKFVEIKLALAMGGARVVFS